ncbi:MAG: LacI family transcriptional regulator [Rariglobus sp.]|jgi:LacI family transcriptional regulator|nr:LacI family transcriptional regulator [Rariglobus sp.]
MTIREVAKALGLGKTTVAAALHDSRKVSVATRERVKQRARELGYIANPVASGFLRQVRSQGVRRYRANLALVIPMHADYHYLQELIKGASARCRELGYGLDVFRADSYEPEKLTRILLARGILGVGIGPLDDPVGQITLDWSRFATAAYGYTMARPAIHRVVPYHLHGIRDAFRACIQKGFKRIGLALRTGDDQRSDRLWSAGYIDMQRSLPASRRLRPLLESEADYTKTRIRDWLRKERPDVVILQTSGDLLRTLDAAKKLPCVMLDLLPDDRVAGINQQFSRCGALLIDLVSAQVLHNQRGIPETPTISLVEGVWVDHPSFTVAKKPSRRDAYSNRGHDPI